MARKRMIDPSIWSDEGMAALTPRQQLLYIGLFSNADDQGRLRGSPASIRLILPTVYDGVSLAEAADDLAAVLAQMRQLVPYEHEGRQYLAFVNYGTWQKIEHPSRAQLPAPPWDGANGTEASPRPHRALHEGSQITRENAVRAQRDVAPNQLINKTEINVEEIKAAAAAGTRVRAREESASADAAAAACPPKYRGMDAILQAAPGYAPTAAFYGQLGKYAGLDLEGEAIKAVDWLAKHPRQQASAKFVLNWLDKALAQGEPTGPPRTRRAKEKGGDPAASWVAAGALS